jgi:hypothetical protein
MKIATVVMSLVFAGVVAQANEPAHDSHAAPAAPAAATETKVEKKEVVKKGKGHAKTTTTEEKKTEEKK